MRSLFLTISLIFSLWVCCFSQSNFAVELHGMGYSTAKSEYHLLFENNMDFDGRWIFEPGLIGSYEFFVLEYDHAIKLQGGLMLDVAAQPAGFIRIMYRNRLWKFWKHSVNLGFGPTLYGRASWTKFDDYRDHGDFDTFGGLEYRFMPFGAEMTYDFYITNKSDITLTFLYAQPKIISVAIGYKSWIHTIIKHKRKCNTCFYHY